MAPKKTRKTAAAPAASAPTPAAPEVPCVTVTYRGVDRDVLYSPTAPAIVLLANAIRAHGMRFATHGELRLFDQADNEIPTKGASARTVVEPAARLTLREPTPGV